MAYRTIKPVLADNNVAVAGDYVGTPFSFEGYDRAFLFINVTGTLSGTIAIETSNDYVPPGSYLNPSDSPANWCDITNTNGTPLLTALVGAPQQYFIDFTSTGMPWVRIHYTSTGGAGNITSVYTAKEF